MKTWELFKKLLESPQKKFKCLSEPQVGSIIGRDESGLIDWFKNGVPEGTYFNIQNTLDWEWEEIKEPVSFMEAVESGKLLKVNHEIIVKTKYLETFNLLDGLINELSRDFSHSEMRDIILNGKWYIEN